MNEITTAEVTRLTTEISILKQQTAQNIIEIGKRLIAVKELLPHGEWGKWLAEEVEFSQEHARRFMKIAKECADSNSTSMWNLPPTKVFALLDLPPDQREEFVQNNPVEEMSTRELQRAIKERDKAKKAAEQIAAERDDALKQVQIAESERRKAIDAWNEAKREAEQYKIQLAEAKIAGDDDEAKRLSDALLKTDEELNAALKKIEELERQLKEKPIEAVAAEVIEKVPEEVERELNELREKAKELEAKAGQQSTATLKFKLYFDSLVKGFGDLLNTLAEIREEDPENHDRYRKAVLGLIGKMEERL